MADPTLNDWIAAGMPEVLHVDGVAMDWSCFVFDEIGLCGCGDPVAAAQLLIQVLEWLDERPQSARSYLALGESLPNGPLRELIFHWIDDREWTEHGTCLPGWLTERGKRALKVLNWFVAHEADDG